MDVEFVCIKNEVVEDQRDAEHVMLFQLPEVLEAESCVESCSPPPLPTSYDFAKRVLKLELQEMEEDSFPIICNVMSMAREQQPDSREDKDTKPCIGAVSNVVATPTTEERTQPPVRRKKKKEKERGKAQDVIGTHLMGIRVKTEVVDLEEPSTSTSTALSHKKMKKVKSEPEGEESHMPSSTSAHSTQSYSTAFTGEMGAVQKLLTTLQKPVDVDQVFGDYVSCELRSLHNPDVKRHLKRTITQAILDAMAEDA